jgi:hypothetical protein
LGGTTEYYSSGVDFTIPTITAAPTAAQIRSYRMLNVNPASGRTITFPNRNLEIFEDLTINGSPAGFAAFNDVASRTLTIRRDALVTSGILRFKNTTSQAVTVDRNITVGTSGTFDVENTGARIHTLSLMGDLTNNGAINFNRLSDANITFTGNVNRSITGTNAGASTSLNQLTVNKGTSSSVILNVDVAGTLTAPTNNWLNLQNGMLRLSKASTLTLTDLVGVSFLIPSTAALSLNHASAIVNTAMANNDLSDFILAGKLEILNGTMNIGPIAYNSHNDLEYAATGNPEIFVGGNGTLNVNGQIRRSTSVLLGSLVYTQQNNSTVLVRGKNASNDVNLIRAKFEIFNPGSSFTMKDNSLLIIDRTGLASGVYGDLYLDPTTSSITGGEIRFGTGSTPAAQTFFADISIPLWNLTVDGTTTSKTVKVQNRSISIQNNLSIKGSSVFNPTNYDLTIGGNFENQNPSAVDGIGFGGYQVQSSTQTTTFNGSASAQTISGLGANLTNFANVVFNNSNAGGIALASNSNLSINGSLHILNGNVAAGTNNIFVDGNVINNRVVTNSGAGYFVMGAASTPAQTITCGAASSFGNFRLNNPAGVNLLSAATINGDLKFTAGEFYISNNLLTLGLSATTSGASNLSMVRLNGVSSDAGVKKLYPASASSFTFPIGTALKYTPVTMNVTSNTVAGTVTVNPVNGKHPATTDPLDKELIYYWAVTSTGFNGSTVVTHTYTYNNFDAVNGIEANYRGGRYIGNVWNPQFGVPSSVNATANTITLSNVNYITGEYTAGEQTEFDQLLVFYSRNATSGGNWNTPASWSTDQVLMHAGAAAAVAPAFNSVIIASGHTIIADASNLTAPTAVIEGTLNLNNTIGHNFGNVSGTGTIRMTPTGLNQFIYPGGNYSIFNNIGGGTIEYNSVSAISALPSQSVYNNLSFTGAGTKNLFNVDLLVNGNLSIAAGLVTNTSNRNINLIGNFTNSAAPGITIGTGTFTLSGVNQTITGGTAFYRMVVGGGGIKTLASNIDVTNLLTLTSGIVVTGSNQIAIPITGSIAGASASSYIAGNLRRFIAAGTVSSTFPIGDAVRYAPATVSFLGSTNAGGSILASSKSGDHPNLGTSTLDGGKSVNRYWSFSSNVTGFTSFGILFNFNAADLDGATNTNNLLCGKFVSPSTWSYPTVGILTATTSQINGQTTFGDYQLAENYIGGITWTGTVSSDWNNAGNWTPSFVPTVGDNITIGTGTFQPSFLTPGNGNCKDITFLSGTNLTVPTGYTLTVAGNWNASLTDVSGSGTVKFTSPTAVHNGVSTFAGVLTVASGASLNTNNGITLKCGASLMHGTSTPGAGGSITGTVTVKRAGSAIGLNYNYWSSPITMGSTAFLGNNRYAYNPSAASATDVTGLRAGWFVPPPTMTIGRGYIATGIGTVSFSGTPNNGSLSYGPLVQGAFTNFNLIGNPFPSALNAVAFVGANPQIGGSALYFWDDDGSAGNNFGAEDYATWNNIGMVTGVNSGTTFNGNIASCQSFFIQANSTASVNFTNSMRTTSNSSFFDAGLTQRLWVSVTTEENHYNETLIAFVEDATDGEDQAYDAKKLRGNVNIAMYSKIGSEDYAIQALGGLTTDKSVQLGIDAAVTGPQTFRLKNMDNIPQTAQVILEDTKLGTFHNLRNNPAYQYVYEKDVDKTRFRLHFKPEVLMTSSTESCVQNDGTITIHSPSATAWNYQVNNEQGQSVSASESFTGTKVINGLTGGNYNVILSNVFGSMIQQYVEVASGSSVSASMHASATNVTVTDGNVQFTATATGAEDITWNFGDGMVVTGVLNTAHLYTEPGIYEVTFVASNSNCMVVKTQTITVKGNATGISTLGKQAFSIYPNPASTSATFKMNLPEKEAELNLSLLDAAGRIVTSTTFKQLDRNATLQLDVENVPAGIYQVLIQGKTFSTAAKLTVVK